jgi:hypothetical protein
MHAGVLKGGELVADTRLILPSKISCQYQDR